MSVESRTQSVRMDDDEVIHAFAGLEFSRGVIEYTDRTHLEEGKWCKLVRVEVERPNYLNQPSAQGAAPYYQVDFATREGCVGGEQKVRSGASAESHDDTIRRLNDSLTQALVRAGMLRPLVTAQDLADVTFLTNRDAVILVPDTNALSTGTLHWLLRVLRNTQVWVFPVVLSLTQVQQRDDILKKLDRGKPKQTNCGQAIRSRTQVNATLGLLERCREQYQVLEVDPQLLRYVKPSGRDQTDPDFSDVLEDRLFIEAIHEVFRSTRSRTDKRVVTSDVLLARILHAEGIPTLFLQTPTTPTHPLPCVYYEPLAKCFLGASLRVLLWELAQTFSRVRLLGEDGNEMVQLQAYWPGKTSRDWIEERLVFIQLGTEPAEESSQEVEARATVRTTARLSSSIVPEVSLLQILRLGGALLRGAGSLDEVCSRIPQQTRLSEAIARFSAAILLRSEFAELRENLISPTDRLVSLDKAIASGDLISASSLFERFRPYQALLSILRERGAVSVADLPNLLESRLKARPAKDACKRLARYPVYLGRAWSDEQVIRDGTGEPTLDALAGRFFDIFEEKQRDGYATIAVVLPDLCKSLRISPWFAAQQLERLVRENRFSDLSFQSAAGHRISARDQVLAGRLSNLETASVALDRISIGERPVFTVSRRSG